MRTRAVSPDDREGRPAPAFVPNCPVKIRRRRAKSRKEGRRLRSSNPFGQAAPRVEELTMRAYRDPPRGAIASGLLALAAIVPGCADQARLGPDADAPAPTASTATGPT